jgi:hypothetical protein
MNIGDIIIMSNRNTGYFSWETFAYAGMKGIVENIWEDGSFCINCKTNILICPMKNSYKTNIDGYWIWLQQTLRNGFNGLFLKNMCNGLEINKGK